jgi:hypothetical protein
VNTGGKPLDAFELVTCPASAPMGQIGVIEERRISGSS